MAEMPDEVTPTWPLWFTELLTPCQTSAMFRGSVESVARTTNWPSTRRWLARLGAAFERASSD
ncbi:MAG: hypothetical protein ACJA2W_001046 [Planctomycetota bacterium]|jgi:hypothetical protein